jgi:hypothetical protein
MLADNGFWSMAHVSRTDFSTLRGALFLLIVGAGRDSLDSRLFVMEAGDATAVVPYDTATRTAAMRSTSRVLSMRERTVSPTTVEAHRMHLMQKLNLHNVAEILLYAARKEIVPTE